MKKTFNFHKTAEERKKALDQIKKALDHENNIIKQWAKEAWEVGKPFSPDDFDYFRRLALEDGYEVDENDFAKYFEYYDEFREAQFAEDSDKDYVEYEIELDDDMIYEADTIHGLAYEDGKLKGLKEDIDWFLHDNGFVEMNLCVLCGNPIEGYGNNPYPLEEHGETCDKCNMEKVIPAREAHSEDENFANDLKVHDNYNDDLTEEDILRDYGLDLNKLDNLLDAGNTGLFRNDYWVGGGGEYTSYDLNYVDYTEDDIDAHYDEELSQHEDLVQRFGTLAFDLKDKTVHYYQQIFEGTDEDTIDESVFKRLDPAAHKYLKSLGFTFI